MAAVNKTDDFTKLFIVFPSEVWLLILDHIENANDLINISGSSPVFAKLLQPTKAEKLFPAVWEILGPRLHQNAQWLDTNLTDINNSNPAKRWTVRNRTVLSLRLVNRRWRDAINRFYYTHSLESKAVDATMDRLFTNSSSNAFPWNSITNPYKESFVCTIAGGKRKSIKRFLAHFEQSHSSENAQSFFAKHVCLTIPFDKCYQKSNGLEFEQDIIQLLRTYGKCIHICEFLFMDKYITPTMFTRLQHWLSYLTNVVCLEIRFDNFSLRNVLPSFTALETTLTSMLSELRALTTTLPIPKLEKLEYLNLFYLTPIIANFILETNSHVTHLRLNAGSACDQAELALYSTPLPNLKQLEIPYLGNNTMDFLKMETAAFGKLFSSLSVYFEKELPPLEEMFKIWGSKWGNTLGHLKIYAPNLERQYSIKNDREQVIQQINVLQQEYLPAIKRLQLFNSV